MKFQKAFLSDWLIKKNVDKALKYFHEEAFISKAMYTADCASFGARDFYIKTKNRRKAVLLALSWYIHELKNFRDFYSLDAAELLKGSEVRPLNNIEEDKFGVWPGSNFNKSPLSKVNEVSITLKKILKKRQFYVVLLPLRIGACTLIWVRNGNNWQILYAETICE